MTAIIQFIKKHNVIISLLLAVLGFGYALYEHYNPLSSSLNYYQIETLNVVDFNKDVDKLEVLFNGEDIRKDSLNLKIYKIKLKNDGDKEIEEGAYAKDIPLGLKLENGKIISFNCISPSNYIKENVKAKVENSNTILLNKIIFEKNDYVTIEILVLHKLAVKPQLIPIGKVAGVSSIRILDQNEDANFNIMDFGQFLLVMTGMVFSVLFIGYLFNKSSDLYYDLIKYYRKKKILKYYDHTLRQLSPAKYAVVQIFSNNTKSDVKDTLNTLLNLERTNSIFKKDFDRYSIVEEYAQLVDDKVIESKDYQHEYRTDLLDAVFILEESGLLTLSETDNTIVSIDFEFIAESEAILNEIEYI